MQPASKLSVNKAWASGLFSIMLLGVSQLALADPREAVDESVSVSANEKIYIEVMSGEHLQCKGQTGRKSHWL